MKPGEENFRFDYAAALLLYGDLNDAVSAFEAASRDFPGSARVRIGAGAAQYLAGHYEPAVKALLQAVRIDPEARPAYRLLGVSYETAPALQADIAGAFAVYLKRRDDDPLAHYYYGAMMDGDEAKTHLQRAIKLDPKLAEAHMQLGILAQEAGDLTESVSALQRAVELGPELASAHYRLGLVYQKLGQKEKAKAELDLFRKLKEANEAGERNAIVQSVRESTAGR